MTNSVPGERLLGTGMLGVGTLALLYATVVNRATSGGVAAAAIFTVMIGLCLRNPTLLQDGTTTANNQPNYSSMRVVVLLVVTAFVMLTLKVGWSTASLEALKIDESWAWVLAAVLGGKVTQSFMEGGGGKANNQGKS